MRLPDNIALIFLPPYSPELKIERLFKAQHTRDNMQDKITHTKTAIDKF